MTHRCAGARVQAFAFGSYVPATTTTAATDGTYRLTGLKPGSYRIRFLGPEGSSYATEFYWDTITVGPPATVTGIDADLDASSTVSGSVSGPAGPVAGAEIALFSDGDGYVAGRGATTGADGTFTVSDVPDGTYRVRVTPPAGSGLATEWYGERRRPVVGHRDRRVRWFRHRHRRAPQALTGPPAPVPVLACRHGSAGTPTAAADARQVGTRTADRRRR